MKTLSQLLLITSLFCLLISVGAENPFRNFDPHATLWLWTLPEKDEIPEVYGWQKICPPLAKAQKDDFEARFVGRYEEIRQYVTPERVRSISRWATREMENYRYVNFPTVKNFSWKESRCDSSGEKFLMEATIDTLPSEHRAMKRLLKIFALYNTKTGYIDWVLITIRSNMEGGNGA